MKCHFILQAFQNGIVDIDKNLSFYKKHFPNSKINKKEYADDRDFFIISDIIEDIKLLELNDSKLDTEMKADLYTTSFSGYSFLKLTANLNKGEIEEIANLDFDNVLHNATIQLNGEKQSFIALLSKVLLPFFQLDELLKIFEEDTLSLKDTINSDKVRKLIKERLNFDIFFAGDMPAGGINGRPGPVIIEDNDDEIDTNYDWIDIGATEKQIYQDKIHDSIYVIKHTELKEDFINSLVTISMRVGFLQQAYSMCKDWLKRINEKVFNIRKNVTSSLKNKFYWEELKKNIEIMDLNFLEFHTSIMQETALMRNFPYTKKLEFSKEYKKQYETRVSTKLLYSLLNEVKYAISNISTPGHTHDEHLLQDETEKVHERLLMISFIAMAIPFGIAVSSQEISLYYKLLSSLALISLPIIYFTFRKAQKTLAMKRNKKSELKRRYVDLSNFLRKEKSNQKMMIADDNIPEDIKKDIVEIGNRSIAMMEKRLEILDKKIK